MVPKAEEATKNWGAAWLDHSLCLNQLGTGYDKNCIIDCFIGVMTVILEYLDCILSDFWRGSAPVFSKLGGFWPLQHPPSAAIGCNCTLVTLLYCFAEIRTTLGMISKTV